MMRSVVVSMCTSAFCISRALRTIHSNSNQRSGPHRVPSYSGTFIDGFPAHAIIPSEVHAIIPSEVKDDASIPTIIRSGPQMSAKCQNRTFNENPVSKCSPILASSRNNGSRPRGLQKGPPPCAVALQFKLPIERVDLRQFSD